MLNKQQSPLFFFLLHNLSRNQTTYFQWLSRIRKLGMKIYIWDLRLLTIHMFLEAKMLLYHLSFSTKWERFLNISEMKQSNRFSSAPILTGELVWKKNKCRKIKGNSLFNMTFLRECHLELKMPFERCKFKKQMSSANKIILCLKCVASSCLR